MREKAVTVIFSSCLCPYFYMYLPIPVSENAGCISIIPPSAPDIILHQKHLLPGKSPCVRINFAFEFLFLFASHALLRKTDNAQQTRTIP